jgi:hypothetical protein
MASTLSSSLPTTLGMQIDAVLDEIDSLSSTQLYAIIVAVTVVISFVLLGTHNAPDEVILTAPTSSSSTTANNSSNSSPMKTKPAAAASAGPEPRWHIFRWINWLAMTAFVLSVMEFGWNASTYLHSTDNSVLFQFLVGWSVFLAYFFGFFGVSFVHDIHAADADAAELAAASEDKTNARYVYLILCCCVIFDSRSRSSNLYIFSLSQGPHSFI